MLQDFKQMFEHFVDSRRSRFKVKSFCDVKDL